MSPPAPVSPVLVLPARVVAATRDDCRRAVFAHLERGVAARDPTAAGGAIALDLRETAEVDASGLAILASVQKRARLHGLAVRLRRVPEPVRRLLTITRPDGLFEFEDAR